VFRRITVVPHSGQQVDVIHKTHGFDGVKIKFHRVAHSTAEVLLLALKQQYIAINTVYIYSYHVLVEEKWRFQPRHCSWAVLNTESNFSADQFQRKRRTLILRFPS
jgi:hypothetical protein